MSKNRLNDAEQILDLIRQMIEFVKDDTIPEEEADRMVGRLLVKIDAAIQRYDQGLDPSAPSPENPMKGKMEIETPKPKRKKT